MSSLVNVAIFSYQKMFLILAEIQLSELKFLSFVTVWVLVLSQFDFLIFVTIFTFEFEKMLFELLSFVTIQGLALCPNFIGVLLVFEFLRFFSSQIRFVTFVTILWEDKNHEKKNCEKSFRG